MPKKNLILAGMFLFLALFYSFLFLASRASVKHEAPELSERVETLHEEPRLTPERIKEKEARFKENLLNRPRLLLAATSAIFLVLVCGLIVEMIWFVRVLDKKPLFASGFAVFPDISWNLRDVAQVFVGLFFVEALMLSVELVFSAYFHFGAAAKDFLVVLNGFVRDVFVVFWVIFFVARVKRQSLSALGLGRADWLKKCGQGLVAYVGAVPILILLLLIVASLASLFSYEPPAQAVVEIYLKKSTERFIVFFTIFVAAIGPLIEEIFFRGFAYPALRARFGAAAGMAVTALVFSALHMSMAAFLPIFFLGLFLAYLYEKTGSLIPSMAAHMIHNSVMVGLTLSFKALSA